MKCLGGTNTMLQEADAPLKLPVSGFAGAAHEFLLAAPSLDSARSDAR